MWSPPMVREILHHHHHQQQQPGDLDSLQNGVGDGVVAPHGERDAAVGHQPVVGSLDLRDGFGKVVDVHRHVTHVGHLHVLKGSGSYRTHSRHTKIMCKKRRIKKEEKKTEIRVTVSVLKQDPPPPPPKKKGGGGEDNNKKNSTKQKISYFISHLLFHRF